MYTDPLNVLVPLLVTATIFPPVKLDCLTSEGAIFTLISSMASSEIGLLPPPGKASALKPKLLFRLAPSMVTLLYRPSLPPMLLPFACGVSLVKSVILRLIVGNVVSKRWPTLVETPDLTLAELFAVTITSFSREDTGLSVTLAL